MRKQREEEKKAEEVKREGKITKGNADKLDIKERGSEDLEERKRSVTRGCYVLPQGMRQVLKWRRSGVSRGNNKRNYLFILLKKGRAERSKSH